jgi:hypothetical protein
MKTFAWFFVVSRVVLLSNAIIVAVSGFLAIGYRDRIDFQELLLIIALLMAWTATSFVRRRP